MKGKVKRAGLLLKTVLPLWIRTRTRPVLFVRAGALGDIICTFPAALELKKRHPRAAFVYSCLPDFASLPVMGGITPHVITESIDPKSIWRFLFSAIYHFTYQDEQSGTASSRTIIADFCRQHQVTVTAAHPRLQMNAQALQRAQSLLTGPDMKAGPKIILHLGPSWPVREWPRENWLALVRELQGQGLTSLIQIGSSKHVELGTGADNSLPDVLSLVNQLTLEESLAVISLSDLFIGIDSGLLHAAAALRIPGVGIFGPTSPQFRFAPDSSCSFVVSAADCQGCHHRVPRLHWVSGCPYGIRCMKIISVETVLAAGLTRLRKEKSIC